MKSLTTLLTVLTIAASLPVVAQDTEALAERIDLQRYEFPQEKIHVMTDRGSYLAGDTVRLRAWVVDAATHQTVDASQFVYVQLISPTDSVQNFVKIHRTDDGVFEGYLPLDLDLPEGRYQLSAYTMFMQSAGTEYFYSQPIEVTALSSMRHRIVSKCTRYNNEIDVTLRYENAADGTPCTYRLFSYITNDGNLIEKQYGGRDKEVHFTLKGKDAQTSALLVTFDNYSKYIQLPPQETLDVTFYPEGGYLIPDVENLVTFKLTNTGATTLTTTGELLDQQGRVMAELVVEHDGMGIVKFTPQADGVYTARWKDNFDQDVTFALPQVRSDATVLQVRRNENGMVTVHAAGAQARNALVLLQQRGCMVAAGYESVTINERDLPAGVVQAMLLDSELRCLSERLFFAQNDNTATPPQVSTDRDTYSDREQIKVDVDLSGITACKGDYAVSVIDANSAEESEGNILANLLLQSELRGRIIQPAYYFTDQDSVSADQREQHLDMLMLTQGWRRYDIPRVLRGRLAEPQFPLEKSQVVTGRVLSDWRKKPVVGAQVSLIAPRVEYSATAVTDSLGEFAISMPLLPDSVDCIVMAENVKGKKQMNLELDNETFPQVWFVDNNKYQTKSSAIIEEQQWRLEKGGDWRHIILNELLVTAVRPRQQSRERNPYSLTPNKIAKMEINSIDAAARALPGLMCMDGALYTTGGTAKDRVTIIVDGEPVFQNFTSDVEAIKLLQHNASQFPEEPVYREAKGHIFWYSELGNESNYNFPEVAIAESMVSYKDLEYIYFARAPHGGGTLYIQHREGYHANGKKEPSLYLKITQLMGAQQPVEFYSPRYDEGNCGNEPGSDLRTTLYWNPCVAMNNEGKSTFDFFASDAHNTNYIVTVEGVTAEGKPFRATHNISKH